MFSACINCPRKGRTVNISLVDNEVFWADKEKRQQQG